MTLRQRFNPGDDMPTAEEWNDILRAGDDLGIRSRPIKVILDGDSSPYSWSELDGVRSGEENLYELNDKADLGGINAMAYPSTQGHYVFQYKGAGVTPPAGEGFIQVHARDACTRINLSGATIVIKDHLGVTVASGTTDGGGLFTTGSLPFSGNPYSVTVSKSGYETQVFPATLVTNGATLVVFGDIPLPGTTHFKFNVYDNCGEPLAGATVMVSGPAGFYSTGSTDSAGEFISAEIPRTWEYRGEGNPLGGFYTYNVSHPDFLSPSGSAFVPCAAIDELQFDVFPGIIPCRYYSGRQSAGTACRNRAYPGSLTVTADFSAYDPAYHPYSGTYTVAYQACDVSETNQGVYSSCIDVGDRYLSVNVVLRGFCDDFTSVAGVGFTWFQKGPGIDPCTVAASSPLETGTTCYASGSGGCVTSYSATDGAGFTVSV